MKWRDHLPAFGWRPIQSLPRPLTQSWLGLNDCPPQVWCGSPPALQCSVSCGDGVMERTVQCWPADGRPRNRCSRDTMPETREVCRNPNCEYCEANGLPECTHYSAWLVFIISACSEIFILRVKLSLRSVKIHCLYCTLVEITEWVNVCLYTAHVCINPNLLF